MKNKKLFVGGYYFNEVINNDEEYIQYFDENVDVYSLDKVLLLGFVSCIDEWYKDTYSKDFDILSNSKKIEAILRYTRDDEMAGLLYFDTEEEALLYKQKALEDLQDAKDNMNFAL